ncbi:MAG: gliding motility-associated C-terminal domain-containing protein [Saprospiraceae bacterium]
MRRILILWHILFLPLWGYSQICGAYDTLAIDPGVSFTIPIEINPGDLVNEDLSDPGQGLCGIELNFRHNFVEDLVLTLVSPDGQRVQLTGPSVTSSAGAFTNFAQWYITFVGSAIPAEPDDGFLPRWDNDQPNNFIAFDIYTGSYYPYGGDLDDFNTGNTFGTWTLEVDNSMSPTRGVITGIRLIFCDETGLDCCFADAGRVTDDDVLFCEGDNIPAYVPNIGYATPRPDAGEFGYYYVVSQNDVLLSYDSVSIDLGSLTMGTYQVCGLSYLRSDLLLLPQPDGVYTLTEMAADLGSLTPSFCGDLTGDCQQIVVQAPPPETNIPAAICEGESYVFADTAYTLPGLHTYIFQSAVGCDSLVNIDLTVVPVQEVMVDSTICDGQTVQVGNSSYSTTGTYRDTLSSSIGCDSIIILDLQVILPVDTIMNAAICLGDSIMIGNEVFRDPNTYTLTLSSSTGCDSIITLNLTVLDPQIIVAPYDELTCADPNVLLDAGNSTPSGSVTFEWLDDGDNLLGTNATLSVDQPGEYTLRLSQSAFGSGCTIEETFTITANQSFPAADAGTDDLLTCTVPVITLGGPGTSTGPEFEYQWTTDTGNFLDPTDIPNPRIDAAGRYTLTVLNTDNNCSATSTVDITIDQNIPVVQSLPDTSLTCTAPTIVLTSEGSSQGAEFTYEWQDAAGFAIGNGETQSVSEGGTYQLLIRNTNNNCVDSVTVNVAVDTLSPVVSIAPAPDLTCDQTSIRLNAAAAALDPAVQINWQVANGGVIAADANTLTPRIEVAGTYRLLLDNTRNGCNTARSVTVEDIRTVQRAEPSVPDIISCGQTSVSLDVGTSSGGPNVIYQWSTSNGQFTGASTGAAVTVNAAGTYLLTVLDTLSRCSDQATVEVFRDQNSPVAEAGTGFAIDCQTSRDTLFATGSTEGPNIVYAWSGPCLQSPSDASFVIVDCPGRYYLDVTDTDNNCTVRDSVEVLSDQETPTVILAPVDTLNCVQAEVTLDAAASQPTGNLTFIWSGPDISGTITAPSVAAGTPGIYELIVVNTDNFCRDTLTIPVTENVQFPQADAGPEVFLTCADPSGQIGGPATSAGPFFTYNWLTIEGPSLVRADTSVVPVSQAGIYRLIVTDIRNGCQDSSSVVVQLDGEVPGANAGFDQEIGCGNELIELDGTNSVQQPGITYQWSGPCLLGQTDLITAQAGCPGDYILSVLNTNTGCSAQDTVTITLNPAAPVAMLPDTVTVDCDNGTAILDGTASSDGLFVWTKDGEVVESGLESITVDDAGWYFLSVSNLDGSCVATDSVLVTSSCFPEAVITPSAVGITCQSPTVVLDATNSTGQALDYNWIAPDPSCIVNGQGTAQLEISCGGEYTLILTNTSVQLSDTQSVVITMDTNMPQAVVGPPDTLTCAQTEVILDGSASSSAPGIVYTWTRVSNGQVIAQTPTTVTSVPGTFILEVIDTASQCRSSATLRIVEYNLPITLAFSDSLIGCGQDSFPLTVFPTPLSDFYTYEWTGPALLAQPDSQTAIAGDTGRYSVRVVDERSQCEAVASVNLMEDNICNPCITIATSDTLTCSAPGVTLEAEFCRTCTGCVLQWTTADGNIVSDGNTLTPLVDQPGTYRLTVIDLQGFRTDVEVEVAADNSIPKADAGPDRFLTCDSIRVHLGGSLNGPIANEQYSWTIAGDPATIISAEPNPEISSPGMYILNVQNTLTGCASTDSVTVLFDTIVPVAEAGPDAELDCNTSFIILDAGDSSSGNSIQYLWTTSSIGNCIQGANAVNPIATCPGTYYLQVTNTVNGCTATDSLLINSSDQLPQLMPLPDTSFICGRDSITLQGNTPAPTGYRVEWCAVDENGTVIAGSCMNDLELQVGDAGLYRFSVTDDATDCQSSFIVRVSDERTLPMVDAGPDRSLRCTDDSLQLNATIGPDPSALDIIWLSANGLPVSGANTLTPIIYNADTLILQVTNRQTGCMATDSVIITQDVNAPVVDAGPDTMLTCLQTTLRLQGFAVSASGSNLIYQWTTADGNIQANANTLSPLINRPGTYVLEVTDSGNGCSAGDIVVVSGAQDAPLAVIAGLDSLQFSCDIDSLLLDASGSVSTTGGELSYAWSVVSIGHLLGDTTQTMIYTDAIGTYRLVVTDQTSGCRDSLQFTLGAAFGAPVIRIASPEQFTCERTSVTLDAGTSEYGAGYSAIWYDEQGNILLQDALQLTVDVPGSYSLQIDNNNTGCSNISTPVSVTFDTLTPEVRIAAPDLLDCAITSVDLNATASSSGPTYQYQWTTSDGLLLEGNTSPVATAGATGWYQLQITNIRNGCMAMDSILVEAITDPITGTDLLVAHPGCANVQGAGISVNEVIGGTAPYSYALNSSAEQGVGVFSQLEPGTYTLMIRDANGCEWEEEVTINTVSEIDVDLGPDLTILVGDSVQLEAQTSSLQIEEYHWEPAAPSAPTRIVAPEVSTSYAVTVTDSNGCTASDRVFIQVRKERTYFLPTVFSPDGDGNNDQFMVFTGPEVVNVPVFRIFNRWGHLVFERLNIPPNDPNLGWDGRHNGQMLNAGVFVYQIELEYNDGWVEVVKGDVTLLR